jgi:hypothetical protein
MTTDEDFHRKSMALFTVMRRLLEALNLQAMLVTIDQDPEDCTVITQIMSTLSLEDTKAITDLVQKQVHEEEPKDIPNVQA